MTKRQRNRLAFMIVFGAFFVSDKQYGFSDIWVVVDGAIMLIAAWLFVFGKDDEAE